MSKSAGLDAARRLIAGLDAARAARRDTDDLDDQPLTRSELIHQRALERARAEKQADRMG